MNYHNNHNHSQDIEIRADVNSATYTCPMHPEVKEDKPGSCPECGMNLVKVKSSKMKSEKFQEHEKYNKHAGHSTKMFLIKFWLSLILTIPILIYSELPEKFFGWKAPIFVGSQYLQLILGSVVFFYCGWVFIAGAWREIRAKLPGMMTLIGIAVSAAYLWSVYATIKGEHTLFWELTTLITVMLLGHWIEMKAVQGTQGALRELAKLLPDKAEVLRNDKTETVKIEELKAGDIILVRPGGSIAADGIIISGKSEVNESMITGESKPILKEINSQVIAGTMNGDGALQVKVLKIGENTFLSGIMRLVKEAQASKSRLQMLSDKAALYLTITALSVGILTFIVWILASAGVSFAMERLVAVLVIACPHALGLAVPLVASISTTLAARNGFLVKQRLALEMAKNINIVMFDKTGTLTKGEFGIDSIIPAEGVPLKKLLQFAASVDSHSEHFVGKAIVDEAKRSGLQLLDINDFQRIPGKGVKGIVNGSSVLVGGEKIFEETGAELSEELKPEVNKFSQEGKTIIFIIIDDVFSGFIALGDVIRDESKEAIALLKKNGIKVAMITGDTDDVARWVAGELDIDEYFSKVLPEDKAGKVKALQERGLKVAMVGDGVNDAPVLTQADLGIAVGAGTNIAIESAGIILMKNDPRDIWKIIELSKRTYSKMLQNLFWATGYNIVAMPLAAGVLVSRGIILQPAASAVLMSLSTVIVAANAVLLRRFKFSQPE